jgi:hypothetical protein
MVSWMVGNRSSATAYAFMKDVSSRLANRVQITADSHKMHRESVWQAFGWNNADYAMIDKAYRNTMIPEDPTRRYSPAVCTGVKKEWMMGNPDMDKVSTSYVEHANLSMRMEMRRFSRLTNAFSKKAENHGHAVSLYFMHYNFCRAHQTLTKEANGIKTSPAMAAGLTDHVWSVEEILKLMSERL